MRNIDLKLVLCKQKRETTPEEDMKDLINFTLVLQEIQREIAESQQGLCSRVYN